MGPLWRKLVAQDEEQLKKTESAFRRIFCESVALEAAIALHMLVYFARPPIVAGLLPFFFPATLLWSLVVTLYSFHWAYRVSRYRKEQALLMQQAAEQELSAEREHAAGKLRAINSMAAEVAHNFNNILTGVLGFSELAKRSLQDKGAPLAEIEAVIWAAKRGASLTRKLLSYATPCDEPPQRFTLNSLAQSVAAACEEFLPDNLKLVMNVAARDVPIEGPRKSLEASLLHICANAHEAMPLGGTLTITAETASANPGDADGEAGFAVSVITDTGVGIEPDIQEKMFDPFFSTKGTVGVGLGLAIAKRVIEDQGGTIAVESTPGRGTTVRVCLPIAKP